MRLRADRAGRIDLERTIAEVLDQRLLRDCARPLALAMSGGGDSVALLLAAAAWAEAARRPLIVLTVDHGLQPDSAAWTAACAARARRIGADFRALRWTGDKPARGLPAAARQARHRLLAQAAREAGARVILLGHTADDILEARAMRANGATTPEPRVWGPSPAWPEGRGVFLLRPLLSVRRAQIRRWLEARGETWIEDPANLDMRFARARARRDLSGDTATAPPAEPPHARTLAAASGSDAAGVLHIDRARLREAAPAEAAAFVGAACLCAAGTTRPPTRARLARLLQGLAAEKPLTATLAGARIEANAREVRFLREPGEAARGGLRPLAVPAGGTAVWDGRFEIRADRPIEVRALAGLAAQLPKAEREALAAITVSARPGLPAAVNGRATCLALDPRGCRPLALDRLHAALGLVDREPD